MASEREVRKLEKVFAEKRDQLQEFIADHGQVFDLFFGLVDEYNTARKEAVDAFRSRPGTDPMSMGIMTRSRAPETYEYQAHQLPQSVLKTPGVVKAIDTKVIEQGIIAGTFDADLINAARSKKYGSPRVSAPQAVVIKVS